MWEVCVGGIQTQVPEMWDATETESSVNITHRAKKLTLSCFGRIVGHRIPVWSGSAGWSQAKKVYGESSQEWKKKRKWVVFVPWWLPCMAHFHQLVEQIKSALKEEKPSVQHILWLDSIKPKRLLSLLLHCSNKWYLAFSGCHLDRRLNEASPKRITASFLPHLLCLL